jgi:hypothetical protein
MSKFGWIVVTVFVLALAATALVHAQARAAQGSTQAIAAGAVQVAAQAPRAGGPPRGGFGQMSDAERARVREQSMERALDRAGLTDKEKAAAKKAMTAKEQARSQLRVELGKLRQVAASPKPTEKQLQDALSAYRRTLEQYRKKAAAEDAALVKQLSLKSQVRCMALGILDNGLGFGRGMGTMGGGTRGGGFGGGRGRGL